MHPRKVEVLARYWQEPQPDLVVSLIPHFNRAIFEGLRAADLARGRSATPMATIMTDLADYPPHFWIERQDQYLICGTATAAEQARAIGLPPERVLRTSGMIVRPEFYKTFNICREQERCRLGLLPDLTTGLVMFGGFGSRRMMTIAKQVADARLKTQLIFLCGRNQRLREQLAAMELPFPHYVEGFVPDVPFFMKLADFFIGKPGPGSISEALVMGLPVIVESTASTMAQERYNIEWIVQERVGIVLRSFSEIAKGIATMLNPQHLARFRNRASALGNRAVFEVPGILDRLIADRSDGFETYTSQAQA
jgi:Glycosyltransferase family 28 C-terminal domain